MVKINLFKLPETKYIAWLALTLIIICGGTMATIAWLTPENGPALMVIFIMLVGLISTVCYFWLRQVVISLQTLTQQIKDADHNQVTYDLAFNNTGLFSNLHNELYRYIRQTQSLRDNIEHDRQQLTTAITDIAHQLRTPIATTQNLLDLVTPQNLTTEQSKLQQQNQRLIQLVNQLILLAKVDTHTLARQKNELSLSDLIKQSLNLLLVKIAAKDLKVDWQVKPDLQISVNAALFQEALVNLIKNNYEHAPEHSTLTIAANKNDISTIITITNQGAPIPEQDLPHLFERFYRGRQSPADNLGIGLAIANGIIQASDGRLTIANQNHGVGYRIELFR
ncbi:sensor histidine kinase [Lapidilactobacillus bayanensis]|uniref:sensor histidine kinase n=1 Tax=Lapidilactobacillus bayanensis TaxID=2485998 RepID=UPI000F7AA5B8|nr:HAMP domain-containing sensor histidine kinase [Lapidilactobacillus bayanensis]